MKKTITTTLTQNEKTNDVDRHCPEESNIVLHNFKHGLDTLKVNNKSSIAALTTSASIGSERAIDLVDIVVKHETKNGILKLYLMDSIIKNIGGIYLPLFTKVLNEMFLFVFTVADASTRKKLYSLRHTWNGVFSQETLLSLDIATNGIDVNWPVESIQFGQRDAIPLRKSTRTKKATPKAANALKAIYNPNIGCKKPATVNSESNIVNFETEEPEEVFDTQSALSQRISKAVSSARTSKMPATVNSESNIVNFETEEPEEVFDTQSALSQRISKAVSSACTSKKPAANSMANVQMESKTVQMESKTVQMESKTVQSSPSIILSQSELEQNIPDDSTNEIEVEQTVTSIGDYISDATPPPIEKLKAKRNSKNWVKVHDYPSYDAAMNEINAEMSWAIISSNDTATTFRCNKVKARGQQSQSGLRIVLSESNLSVCLYVSRNEHNCDTLEKRAVGMTNEIRELILELHRKGLKTKSIQDEFISRGIPLPPKYLIENVLARLRREENGQVTLKVSDLHKLLTDHCEIPDNDNTAFVVDHQINDTETDIRFNFVVSSKKLLQNNLQSKVCNADSTYKLIWQGFPVQVIGSTDGNKKFHPTCIAVSTNEETEDFEFIFTAVKNATKTILATDLSQPVLVCDAAKAISNAYRNVHGSEFVEIMCWFHAKCAMEDKVAVFIPKEYQSEIIADIEKLQLSQNPAMFEKASQFFREKYNRFDEFIEYFEHQWLQLNRNWYEGACADIGINAPSCNNGLEVFNRTIKDEKTLRKRLPLQQFFTQLLVWVESWSKRYEGGANIVCMNKVIDLPLMTKGYQWAKMNKKIKKHADGFILVPSDPATNLDEWDDTLQWENFDEFRVNVFKGWRTTVPEQQWIDGTCNCPSFFKDFMCKHIVGIAIRLKLVVPSFEAKQIPIGEKRKRGRPKKAKKALLRQ